MSVNWLRQAVAEGNTALRREGAEQERARIVAFIRREANDMHPIETAEYNLSPAGRGLLLLMADQIERGES